MHEVPVSGPFLGLATHLAVFAFLVSLRSKPGSEMVDEVLDDEAGFREHQWLVQGFGLDCDNWRLTQRMYSLQLFGRELVLTLISLDFIVDFELLKKP